MQQLQLYFEHLIYDFLNAQYSFMAKFVSCLAILSINWLIILRCNILV